MLYGILNAMLTIVMFGLGFFAGYCNRTDFYEKKRKAYLKHRRDKYRERKERRKRECGIFSFQTTEK